MEFTILRSKKIDIIFLYFCLSLDLNTFCAAHIEREQEITKEQSATIDKFRLKHPNLVNDYFISEKTIEEIIDIFKRDFDINEYEGESEEEKKSIEELFKAIRSNDIKKTKELITNRANLNVLNEGYEPALIEAIWLTREEIAKLLINAGADVNVINKTGSTPLMLASSFAQEDVVNLLLSLAVNVDAVNQDKQTALMLAISRGAAVEQNDPIHQKVVNIVKALLCSGADIDKKDKKGNKALDIARSSLVEHPNPVRSEIILLLENESTVRVQLIKNRQNDTTALINIHLPLVLAKIISEMEVK